MPLSIFGWRLKGPVMPKPMTKGIVSGGEDQTKKRCCPECRDWSTYHFVPCSECGYNGECREGQRRHGKELVSHSPRWKYYQMEKGGEMFNDRRTTGERRQS